MLDKMLKKSFPAAQNQDISSSVKSFTTQPGKRRSKRNKTSQAYISEPVINEPEPNTPGGLGSSLPWGSAQFGQSTFNTSKLSTPSFNERTPNLFPSPGSTIFRSVKGEKDDFELGTSFNIGSPLMKLEEPSYCCQDGQEEIFSGDKDVEIWELTLKCAKIKQKYISERQSVTLLRQKKEKLKHNLDNERKRYSNLEKNFSLKDTQIYEAVKKTNDLEHKLLKASLDEPFTARARKWKKDMFIPEDQNEFKEQLEKMHNSKTKLEELASQIFDKYYDSKQMFDSLSKSNNEARAKYNQLLYDYGELGKFRENMQKKYDLEQNQVLAMSNDLDKAIERKLLPSINTIEKLKREIKQTRENFEYEKVALELENMELLEMFKDLENQKDGAEYALKQKTKHSQMMVDKLWHYKSQVEQHELTIRQWKCFLIQETNYLKQGLNNGILQPLSRKNPEIKKELGIDNDGQGLEMTLRIYKIPATGIIYLEVIGDCTNSIVPALRKELFDIRAVRHLLTEGGQMSNTLSIVMPDQVLLLQSCKAQDIVTTLDAILEVNNLIEDNILEPVKIKKRRRMSLPSWREKSVVNSPSPAPSLPILGQVDTSEVQETRPRYASFFTCM